MALNGQMSYWRVIDVGSLVQTICLAALEFGLGTCIAGQVIQYPDVVRKYAGIPESKRMVIGLTIGYPDWDHPANKLESTRDPLENVVTWCGFDQGHSGDGFEAKAVHG